VIPLRTNRKQPELSQARVRVKNNAVRLTYRFPQFRPYGKPVIERGVASIRDRNMPQTLISSEELPALVWPDEPDLRVWKSVLRGFKQNAGHRDVCAKCDSR